MYESQVPKKFLNQHSYTQFHKWPLSVRKAEVNLIFKKTLIPWIRLEYYYAGSFLPFNRQLVTLVLKLNFYQISDSKWLNHSLLTQLWGTSRSPPLGFLTESSMPLHRLSSSSTTTVWSTLEWLWIERSRPAIDSMSVNLLFTSKNGKTRNWSLK